MCKWISVSENCFVITEYQGLYYKKKSKIKQTTEAGIRGFWDECGGKWQLYSKGEPVSAIPAKVRGGVVALLLPR